MFDCIFFIYKLIAINRSAFSLSYLLAFTWISLFSYCQSYQLLIRRKSHKIQSEKWESYQWNLEDKVVQRRMKWMPLNSGNLIWKQGWCNYCGLAHTKTPSHSLRAFVHTRKWEDKLKISFHIYQHWTQ